MNKAYTFLMLMLFVLSSVLSLEAQNKASEQEVDPFAAGLELFDNLNYLRSSSWVAEEDAAIFASVAELKKEGIHFEQKEPQKLRIAHHYIDRNPSMPLLYFESPSGKEWMYWIRHEEADSIAKERKRMGIFRMSTIGGNSSFNQPRAFSNYLVLNTGDELSTVNVFFVTPHHILRMGLELDFPVPEDYKELSQTQNKAVLERFQQLLAIVKSLGKHLVPESEWIKKPLNGKRLTAAQRLYGFTQFWTEVKYNFAFFDQVPDLDWDEVLYEYLPIIQADQSNEDYYQTLKLICAKLGDGHTNIYPPREDKARPGVQLKNFGQKAFVVNVKESLAEKIPLGSELLAVEGIAVENYLREKIFPYISSSTDHIRYNWGIRDILAGKTGSEIEVEFRSPEGKRIKEVLVRDPRSGGDWIKGRKGWQLFEFTKTEGDFAHVKLNSFGRENIIEEFEKRLDSIKACKGVIIDLRGNGGGSSSIGYAILNHFTKKPYKGSQWRTREHRASYKAWGKFVDESLPFEELSEWDKRAKLTLTGEYWYVAEPSEYKSDVKDIIKLPVVVLIGNNTASAAEDFLVALDQVGIAKLIGSPTFGSTGQPLMMDLPGGGSARICTKRDTYPDGREFVGYGIPPDYQVAQTVEDYLNEKDVVLEYAVNFLKENPDFSKDKK